MSKDREPGKWDSSSSGHVDSGEDYDACTVRELREELDLTVPKTPERLFKIDACAGTDQEFVWVYRCEAKGRSSCIRRKSNVVNGLRRRRLRVGWLENREISPARSG